MLTGHRPVIVQVEVKPALTTLAALRAQQSTPTALPHVTSPGASTSLYRPAPENFHRFLRRGSPRLEADDGLFLLEEEAELVDAGEQAVAGERVDGELHGRPVGE